jgi:hypothetical protein
MAVTQLRNVAGQAGRFKPFVVLCGKAASLVGVLPMRPGAEVPLQAVGDLRERAYAFLV